MEVGTLATTYGEMGTGVNRKGKNYEQQTVFTFSVRLLLWSGSVDAKTAVIA
jgi:hypothetical protein